MKRTGEILRKAREEKKLSLHEIGLSLKISSKVLKSIEEGDEKSLPAKTFLRGFVQSYANFLHLNSDEVLAVFYEEMGSTRYSPYLKNSNTSDTESSATPVDSEEKSGEDETPKSDTPSAPVISISRKSTDHGKADGMHSLKENKTTKKVILAVLSIVLVGLIIFTKKMIDKYSKEAEVPSGEVAQTLEGTTPVIAEAISLETESDELPAPVASPPPTPATTEQVSVVPAVATPTPAPITTPKPMPSPTATAAVVSTPSPSPSPKPTVTPTPKPSPVIAPAPTPEAAPAVAPSPVTAESSKPVELIIEALDTVEIEYSAPNGKPQKIKLSAEQVHTFKSRSGLKLNLSNGGAVNLILNGKDVGIPGDLGKPIKLSY